MSKPAPLGVTVHTTLVDVADDLLRDIQGRLIRLSKLKLRIGSIAILNALEDLPAAKAGNTMIEELMVVGETVAASESDNHVADMAAALKSVVKKYGSLAKAPENFVPQSAAPTGKATGYLVTGSPAASPAASPKKKTFEPPGVRAQKVQEGSPYAAAPPQRELRDRGREQGRRSGSSPAVAERSQSRGAAPRGRAAEQAPRGTSDRSRGASGARREEPSTDPCRWGEDCNYLRSAAGCKKWHTDEQKRKAAYRLDSPAPPRSEPGSRRGGDKPRSQAFITEAAPESRQELPSILQRVAPIEMVVTDDTEPCLQRGNVNPNKEFLRSRVACVVDRTPAAALGVYFLGSNGQPVKYTKRMLSADLNSNFLRLPAQPAQSPVGVERGPAWKRRVQWRDVFDAALAQHDAAQSEKPPTAPAQRTLKSALRVSTAGRPGVSSKPSVPPAPRPQSAVEQTAGTADGGFQTLRERLLAAAKDGAKIGDTPVDSFFNERLGMNVSQFVAVMDAIQAKAADKTRPLPPDFPMHLLPRLSEVLSVTGGNTNFRVLFDSCANIHVAGRKIPLELHSEAGGTVRGATGVGKSLGRGKCTVHFATGAPFRLHDVTKSAELEENTLLLSAHKFSAEHGKQLGMKWSEFMTLLVPNPDSVQRDARNLVWDGGLLHMDGVTSITAGISDAPTSDAAMLVHAAAPPVLPPSVSANHRGRPEAAAYMFYEEGCEVKPAATVSDQLTDAEVAAAVAAIDGECAKHSSSDVVGSSTSGDAVSTAASADALESFNGQVIDMLDGDAAAVTMQSYDAELNNEGVTSTINHVVPDEQAMQGQCAVVATDKTVTDTQSASGGESDDDDALPDLVDTSESEEEGRTYVSG